MAPPPSNFSYTPLPPGYIRLLEIAVDRGKLPGSLKHTRTGLFDEKDLLTTRMYVTNLADPPLYDALSYTWGNPLSAFKTKIEMEQAEKTYSSNVPIFCQGKLLNIGFSLYEALAGLRRTLRQQQDLTATPGGQRALKPALSPFVRNRIWIDAVCINQSDGDERSSQVKMMHLIYRKADAVLIWLGPQEDVARRAGRAMLDLATAPDVVTQTLRLSEANRRAVFDQKSMVPIYDADWFYIVSFLQRQWFRRAGVVQEIGQARMAVVVCSHDLWLDFTVLMLVAEWMASNQKDRDVWMKPWLQQTSSFFQSPSAGAGDLIGRGIRSVVHIRNQVRPDGLTPSSKKSSLLELLVRFWGREASVAHDKVYALMSLCQDATLIDSIPVDYAKPAAEVYTETARGILESMGRLDLLMYSSGDAYSGPMDLPTWVPNWSKKPGSVLLGHDDWLGVAEGDYDVTFPFCADGNADDSPAAVWEGRSFRAAGGSSLTVQGKMVATIRNTAQGMGGSLINVLNDLPLEYSYLKPVPLQPCPGPPEVTGTSQDPTASGHQAWAWARSDETRFEALWRTVLRDTWKGCWPAPDEAGMAFVRLLADKLGECIKKYTEVDEVDLFIARLPLPQDFSSRRSGRFERTQKP